MDRVMEVTIKANATVYHVGDGHYYYLNRRKFRRAFLICAINKSCPGRASMPADPELRFANSLVMTRPHNHDPKHNWMVVQLIRKRILERCAAEGPPYRTIYDEETEGLDPETAGELPFQSLSTAMFRARRQELGLIPASLVDHGQALEKNASFGSTKRGEQFYREDSELASQLPLFSMTSSIKKARKAESHTEVGNEGAMLVESDPCASMSNLQNVTDPFPSMSNIQDLGDPCASTIRIQNLGDPRAITSDMETEDGISSYTSPYEEPEIALEEVPEFGDFERQMSQVSSILASTAKKIPAPLQDAVIGERREAPPSITTVSTDSASVKVKPINTLQSIDTSVEERKSYQKDGVGIHIDISVKTLESAIHRLESVSNKLTAASLIDSYDQFGKYISSVLRGLPVRKVHYLKQKIMSDLMDTVSQEVVGIAKTPTPHPTQHTQPTEYTARSDVRFDKDQSNANLPQDPHNFVSRLGGKMLPLYSSVLAPNQQPPAATIGSNSFPPSSCSSDKSSFTTTLKVADRGFTAANAPKSVSAATPSPQSSDPLSPRPSSARGRKRRKTSAVRLDNRKNSGQDFEEMDKEGVELARIKQDQYLFETVLCGESSTLYIKEEVPDSEEPPQVSSAALPPPANAPQPPVTCHLCSVQCGSREDLTNHLNTKHPGCNSVPDPNRDVTSRDYFKT